MGWYVNNRILPTVWLSKALKPVSLWCSLNSQRMMRPALGIWNKEEVNAVLSAAGRSELPDQAAPAMQRSGGRWGIWLGSSDSCPLQGAVAGWEVAIISWVTWWCFLFLLTFLEATELLFYLNCYLILYYFQCSFYFFKHGCQVSAMILVIWNSVSTGKGPGRDTHLGQPDWSVCLQHNLGMSPDRPQWICLKSP